MKPVSFSPKSFHPDFAGHSLTARNLGSNGNEVAQPRTESRPQQPGRMVIVPGLVRYSLAGAAALVASRDLKSKQ